MDKKVIENLLIEYEFCYYDVNKWELYINNLFSLYVFFYFDFLNIYVSNGRQQGFTDMYLYRIQDLKEPFLRINLKKLIGAFKALKGE